MSRKYSSPVYVLDIPWQLYDLVIAALLAFLAALHVYGHAFGGALGRVVTIASGLGFLTIVYGSFIEPRLLRVRRYSVGTGEHVLKVAFISDIHVGPYKKAAWVRHLAERTNALKPDITLLGGDFLYKKADALPELEPFKDFQAPLGVYAILGNHDEWEARQESLEWFRTSSVPLLHNRSVRAERDGVSVVIAGAEDDWYGETDLAVAFKDIPSEGPLIVMLHNPDLAPPAAELLKDRKGTTVFFCGHTHGGQIRLPFWGSVMRLPHHLGQKYDRGVFVVPVAVPGTEGTGIPMIIGAGTGESGPRARLFCPPEIVLTEVRF